MVQTPIEQNINAHERVALHYERKSARLHTALGAMCSVWAAKARAGRTNPLVRRVRRLMGEAA